MIIMLIYLYDAMFYVVEMNVYGLLQSHHNREGELIVMKAEYVNPFIEAFDSVASQVIGEKSKKRNIFIKEGSLNCGEVTISIGVTGELSGSILMNLNEKAALNIASRMMGGMEVPELNDLAKSAVAELANMIAGNATVHFSSLGKAIDITPPVVYTGKNVSIYNYKTKTICVPLDIIGDTIEIDISIA